jgi:oligopeptide/dipeptide ABC transporter ATP-binding protein
MTRVAGEPLVEVRGLKVHFPVLRGLLRREFGAIRAVDGVSFEIFPGETLGMVGESGSGKSTTGRAMLRLVRSTAGGTRFQGGELSEMGPSELRAARGRMQMVFQDPHASLNPRMSVRRIVREPLEIHGIGTPKARNRRVDELLELVGLSARASEGYPHEFSGGQLQRVGIARALATQPEFLVADEPISALDVSIQAQIVNLLSELKEELGLTYLFIAHDLSMVRFISDRVAVMYLGRIVEIGDRGEVFDAPLHPYTRALISAIPVPDPDWVPSRGRVPLEGELPDPASPPSGCRFHTRCSVSTERCSRIDPELRDLGSHDQAHWVACHHAEELVEDLSRAHPEKTEEGGDE